MTNEELQPQPFILVQGQRVGLGALRHDLIPTYLKWRSDLEVLRGTGESAQIPTVEAMQAWYEQATSPDNRDVHFTTPTSSRWLQCRAKSAHSRVAHRAFG
jgi:hypothetical protein